MKKEIEVASWWWAQQIFDNVAHDQLVRFQKVLVTALETKFRGHWDEGFPLKGNGFRSLMVSPHSNRIDDVLNKAAAEVGVKDLKQRLPPYQEIIMWVDPGEVIVKYGADKRLVLYKDTARV
eukprot:TRINITY_DN1467_c0_g1_i1.p1 TRINITY_DN1467_c0_g1~~TRINITY_DN1467_c0_g1_i1.p1  ORF type:complete len:122 (-),score=35.46 TRINITY_DN1467_c0_g1_i1:217-582(-)